MIAPKKRAPAWHPQFLAMLPGIRRYAHFAFRWRDPESRDEMVQEVTANSLEAFLRLHELGKSEVASPFVLARYGVRRALAGRRVGSRLNANDVSSVYSQRKHGHHIGRLDRFDRQEECWKEVLVEDRRCGPADIAAARIDIGRWLDSLPLRNQQIAQVLATGESTRATARRFGLSDARISQLRGELREGWRQFQGEPDTCRS